MCVLKTLQGLTMICAMSPEIFIITRIDLCDVDDADDECWVSCRVAITVMTNGGGPSNIEGRELRIIGAAK